MQMRGENFSPSLEPCPECDHDRAKSQDMPRQQTAFTARRPSRPPFGSSEQKFRNCKQPVPGPGQYQLRSDIVKKQLILMRNDAGQIRVVNKPVSHAVFLSKTPKFLPLPKPAAANHPPHTAPQGARPRKIMQPSPNRFQVELLTRRSKTKVQSKIKAGAACETSPTKYKSVEFSQNASKKGFLRFSQVKSAKFSHQPIKKAKVPGPGHYFQDSLETALHENAAPFLTSNLKGKTFVWQNVNVPLSDNSRSESEDSFDRFVYSNQNPGPGSYQIPRTIGKQSRKTRRPPVPFGSNELRFRPGQQPQPHNSTQQTPAQRKARPNRRRRPSPAAFNTTQPRFCTQVIATPDQEQQEATQQFFNYRIFERSKQRLKAGRQGNFGSTDARFKKEKKQETPSPGDYYQAIDLNQLRISPIPSSSFASHTRRIEKRQPDEPAPPYYYDLNYGSIGARIQSYLQSVQDLKQAPFLSTAVRWKEQVKEQRFQYIHTKSQLKKVRRVGGFARPSKS